MRFPQLLRIPKVQLALILFLILLSTLFQYPFFVVTKMIILPVFFTVGSDLLFMHLRKHTLYVPYAAVVTGFILGITINPDLPWYGILLISVLASASKHFVKIAGRHVFNPAALGLVAGNILLRNTVSWWGVFSVAFFILLLPLTVSGIRLKRFGGVVACVFTYSLLLLLLQNVSPRITLMDPAVLFFTITMLPDPMTSPVVLSKQIVFGAFVATTAIVFSYVPFMKNVVAANFLPDGLLPFLLLGNLVFFKFR